jgi:broad specificity phosphatase PhoE
MIFMENKKTLVYFVRHGETDYNAVNRIQGQINIPLNESGLRQAECAGERLKSKHFDVIYSSDLDRAMVTAQKIADGREIFPDERLREWNLGHWQGKLMSEVRELYPEEVAVLGERVDIVVKDGESALQLRDRAAALVTELVRKHPGKEILCVTHGGFMRTFLMYAFGMEYYPKAQVDNTSYCCFSTSDGGETWSMVFWNDINHLQNGGLDCCGFVF